NAAAFTRYQRNGKRIAEKHRTCVATRHDLRRFQMMSMAHRIAFAISLMCFLEGLLYGRGCLLVHGVLVSLLEYGAAACRILQRRSLVQPCRIYSMSSAL